MHPLAAVIVLHLLHHHCFGWIASRAKVLEYFQKTLAENTPLRPMARRDFVTSMGAWYGFKPRCDFKRLGIDRNDLCRHMKTLGFDVDVPGSGTIPEYRLFRDSSISPPGFVAQPEHAEYPGAAAYCASTISLPTFTFESQIPTVDAYVEAFCDYFNEKGLS